MSTSLAIVLGLLLDRLLGEVPRWHPLVGFGRLANKVEAALNRNEAGAQHQRGRGIAGWLLVVAPFVVLAAWLQHLGSRWLVDAVALYFAVGWRALAEHAEAVATPLSAGNMTEARQRVSYLVSRETASMDEEAAARATVESVLGKRQRCDFRSNFLVRDCGGAGRGAVPASQYAGRHVGATRMRDFYTLAGPLRGSMTL